MDLASLIKAEVEKKKDELAQKYRGDSEESATKPSKQEEEAETTTTSLKKIGEQPNEIEKDKSLLSEQKERLERLRTRPDRVKAVQEKESRIDVSIQLTSIGFSGDERLLSTQCNLYVHQLLLLWAQEGYKSDLLLETKRALFPLLLKLRRGQLPTDLLTSLATILYHLQHSEFTRATESYMKLSIGNVAWPIGVTSVGIHARSAHERIQGNDKIANVMLDEPTRLWITSVKRLITFSEALARRKKSLDGAT